MTLNVNGTTHDVSVSPETPLLWVIRDTLKLTGTKYGCGIGQCGACTVLMNSVPIRSCSTPATRAAGKTIVTIEGLSPDRSHALQRAWVAEQVPQCGYCQSGMLMSSAALLLRVPEPTDAEIDRALSAHICRCGTYTRIRAAIHRAAGDTAPTSLASGR